MPKIEQQDHNLQGFKIKMLNNNQFTSFSKSER